jgi:hypothetical protein
MAAALALAAFAALYEIRTYDTLFHLAAGRYIVEHGELPARDPFSFTFRGAAWVNHSGAFQVLLAGLYAAGGFGLLSLYQALIAAILCGLALFALRDRSHAQCAFGAVLAALPYCAFREVLEARPHVVGFVCLAGLLSLTLHANRAARPRVVWFALPLSAA